MMRSFSGFLGVVMAAGLVGVVPARAQLNTFIEVCGDPKANPSDVVQFCAKALKTGKLSPRATAQVLTNQGVAFYDPGPVRRSGRGLQQCNRIRTTTRRGLRQPGARL